MPGADNTTLISGITLRAGATLSVGQDTFALNVTARGMAVNFDDYLKTVFKPEGFFVSRTDSTDAKIRDLTKRIDLMEARLARKEEQLTKRFAALEATLARLQSQSGAMFAQLGRTAQ